MDIHITLERAADLYRIIGALSRKIQEDRFGGSAYNRRGTCYEQLGKNEYALQDYTSAIEYAPYPHHYTDRARLHLAMGKYAECIADCDMANERTKRLSEQHGMPYQPFSVALLLKAEAVEQKSDER